MIRGKDIMYRMHYADGSKAPYRSLMIEAVVDYFRGGPKGGEIKASTSVERVVDTVIPEGIGL